MRTIELSSNEDVIKGLDNMMKSVIHGSTIVRKIMAITDALLMIQIARVTTDLPCWFPKGKWATIQSIQSKIDVEVAKIVWRENDEA
jgi:hypothetical protein